MSKNQILKNKTLSIAFEGIDGNGKSYLAQAVKKRLIQKYPGIKIAMTTNSTHPSNNMESLAPTNSLMALMPGAFKRGFTDATIQHMFCTTHIEQHAKILNSVSAEGYDLVFLDRCDLSNYAYGSLFRSSHLEELTDNFIRSVYTHPLHAIVFIQMNETKNRDKKGDNYLYDEVVYENESIQTQLERKYDEAIEHISKTPQLQDIKILRLVRKMQNAIDAIIDDEEVDKLVNLIEPLVQEKLRIGSEPCPFKYIKNKGPGKLYVFDGPDNTGKSTMINETMKAFRESNQNVVTLSETSVSSTCRIISNNEQEVLNLKELKDFTSNKKFLLPVVKALQVSADGIVEAYLMNALRYYSTALIKKLIQMGYVVIMDRFYTSTFAYQYFMKHHEDINHPLALTLITALNDLICSDITIDKYIYMSSTMDAIKKVTESKSGGEHYDKFEFAQRQKKAFNKVYETMNRLYPEVEKCKFETDIECLTDPEKRSNTIKKIVESVISDK